MAINYFSPEGVEKAAFFMDTRDTLSPKEILQAFAEQFGAALDPQELIMGLTVLFNILPQDFDQVFNSGCAEFLARLNAVYKS